MALLQNLYGNPIVHSIGWTLLHACWQITLVALVLRFLLPRLERKSAHTAYLAGIMGLLLITIWSAFTFWKQYQYFEEAIAIAQFEPVYNNTPSVLITPGLQAPLELNAAKIEVENSQPWIDSLLYYLPILVVLWFLGILLLLIRLISSWLRIYHLQTQGLRIINEHWLKRFEELKSKLQISQKVQFFASEKVVSPLTLGFFKPMVLVPLGLLTNLSPEMVETVLLHELAHIKRADYLINILQSIVEMTFFFHPGIWWMSKIIRQSREHACDDIAVAACKDPMLYATTLTQLQVSSLTSKNNLAMSLTGNTGSFTTRIKRLFGYAEPQAKKNNTVLFSSLLFTCLLFFAFTQPFECDSFPDSFTEGLGDSESVMYMITPSTTKRHLEKIKSALAKEKIQLEYSNLEYTAFGMIDNIRIDITMPDGSTFMTEVGQLKYISIALDWSKAKPLDVRFQGQRLTLDPQDQGPEALATMQRPFTNNYAIPSMVGNVGFGQSEENRDRLMVQESEDNKAPILLLNGEQTDKATLEEKGLTPNDILRIRRLNPDQAETKLNRLAPNGAYEITARLNKQGQKRGLFFTEKNPATQFKFNVLHKAEIRGMGSASPMGAKQKGPFSISSDNCVDENKALHVLNDRILEVPAGACYPPELKALTEVDSFFMYDSDLAKTRFGAIGAQGAYVFYYRHSTQSESAEFSFKTKPKMNIDRVKMDDIRRENITRTKDAPRCFLNHKELPKNQDGSWPAALSKLEVFDSLVILTSADSKQAYGLTTEEDVWLFYHATQNQSPSLSEIESIKGERPNLLYVLNDQILFTEEGRKTPAVLETIPKDGFEKVFYLKGKDATDKYGDIGKGGVMELYTKSEHTPIDLREQIQISPNPFNDRLTINVALFDKALVKVMVYDQSGRLITDLTEETLEKGYHTFYWMPATSVSDGMYYITVQIGKKFASVPVVYRGSR